MKTLKFLALFLLLGTLSSNAQQDIKVGDIYTFNDNSKGVVFYVDDEGHGLVVSLNQEKRKWEDETHYVYCQDIVNIPNETIPNLEFNQLLGKVYTAYIIEQLGDVKPIAAKYCREQGGEWYIPSAGEAYKLMIANTDKTIDNTLVKNGSKPIEGWYWTSSEYGQGEVWRIGHTGKIKRCSKLALRVYTRPVRGF